MTAPYFLTDDSAAATIASASMASCKVESGSARPGMTT